MYMSGIKYIFCFAILCVFDLAGGLVTLPKVEDNDIAKTEWMIRKTANALFSSLKLGNIRNQTSIKQFSLIHNYFVSLTLQDYSSLKEIAKLTRVDKSDIENVTTNFIALLNEILDEENIVKLETILIYEEIGPRYDIESEIEKLLSLKKMHVENKNKIMNINNEVLKILQDNKTLDLNISSTSTSPDYSNENILDENIFWHETNNLSSGRRIYDGKRTRIRHYPFMASIQIFNKFQCAGCIIKSDLIITAASCLQLAWNNRFYRENPPFLSVRVGSSFYEFGGERIGVQEIYFNPDYDPKTLHNNLAVVRLERKIKLHGKNKKVMKIKIDKIDHKLSNSAGKIEILGWGASTYSNKLHGPFEDKLKHAILHIHPHNECQELYSKEFVTRKHFCGGYVSKGTGACNRDIGGPGLVSGILTGIISFGAPSCGTPDAPTVFTKLGFYYDWIEEIMEQDVPVFKKKTTLKPVTWTYPVTYTHSTSWKLQPPSTKGLLRQLKSKINKTKVTANSKKIKNKDKDFFKDYIKSVFENNKKTDYYSDIGMSNTTDITTPTAILDIFKYDNISKSQTLQNILLESAAQKIVPVEEIQNQIQQIDKVAAQEKENREKDVKNKLRQIIENTYGNNDQIHVYIENWSDNSKLSKNESTQKDSKGLSNYIKRLPHGSKLQENEKHGLVMQLLSANTTGQNVINETPQDHDKQEKPLKSSLSPFIDQINTRGKKNIQQENHKRYIMQLFDNTILNDGEKYDRIMNLFRLQDSDTDKQNYMENEVVNHVTSSEKNRENQINPVLHIDSSIVTQEKEFKTTVDQKLYNKQLLTDKNISDDRKRDLFMKYDMNLGDELVLYEKEAQHTTIYQINKPETHNLLRNDDMQLVEIQKSSPDSVQVMEQLRNIEQLKNKINHLTKIAEEEEKHFKQSEAQPSKELPLKVKELNNQIFEKFTVQTHPIKDFALNNVEDKDLLTKKGKKRYEYILRVPNDPVLEGSKKKDTVLELIDIQNTDSLTENSVWTQKEDPILEDQEKDLINNIMMVLTDPDINEQEKYDHVMKFFDTEEQNISRITLKTPEISTLSEFGELKNAELEENLNVKSSILEVPGNIEIQERAKQSNISQIVNNSFILRGKKVSGQYDTENLLDESTKSKLDSMLEYIISMKPKIEQNNALSQNIEKTQNGISERLEKPKFGQSGFGINSYTSGVQENSSKGVQNLQGNFGVTLKNDNELEKRLFLNKYSQPVSRIPNLLQSGYNNLLDSGIGQTGFIPDKKFQPVINPLQINISQNQNVSIFDKISQSLAESSKYALGNTEVLVKPKEKDMMSSEISGIANSFEGIKNNIETILALLNLRDTNMTKDNLDSILKLRDKKIKKQSNFVFENPILRGTNLLNQDIISKNYQKIRETTQPTKTSNNTLMKLYSKLLKNKDILNQKVKKIVASLLHNDEEKDKPDLYLKESYIKLLQNDDISRKKITQILLSLMPEGKSKGEKHSPNIDAYSNLIKNDDDIKNKIAQILTSLLSDNNDNWTKLIKVESGEKYVLPQEDRVLIKGVDNEIPTELYSSATPSSLVIKQNNSEDLDLRILKALNDPVILKQEKENTLPNQVQEMNNRYIVLSEHDFSTIPSDNAILKPQKSMNNIISQVLPITMHQSNNDLIITEKDTKKRYKEKFSEPINAQNELSLSILSPLPLVSQESNLKDLENTIGVFEKSFPSNGISFSSPTHRKSTFENIAYGFYGLLSNSVNQLSSAIGLQNIDDKKQYNSINSEKAASAGTKQLKKGKNKGILGYISESLLGVPDKPYKNKATAKSSSSSSSAHNKTKTTNGLSWSVGIKDQKGYRSSALENRKDQRLGNKPLSSTPSPLRLEEQERDLKEIADLVFKVLGDPGVKEDEKRNVMLRFASAVEATEKDYALRSSGDIHREQKRSKKAKQ